VRYDGTVCYYKDCPYHDYNHTKFRSEPTCTNKECVASNKELVEYEKTRKKYLGIPERPGRCRPDMGLKSG
jgi:hypothetical protein